MSKRESKLLAIIIFMAGVLLGYFVGFVSTFASFCLADNQHAQTSIQESTEELSTELIEDNTEQVVAFSIYKTPSYHEYIGVCWCSECDMPNSYDVKYCEKCGAEHTEEWYTYKYIQCSTCGDYVFNSLRDTAMIYCPECGTKVGMPVKVLQKDIPIQDGD